MEYTPHVLTSQPVSRRAFLRSAALTFGGAALGLSTAACSPTSPAAPTSAPAAATTAPGAAAATAPVAAPTVAPAVQASGGAGPQLVSGIRSLANEYHSIWAKGATAFAQSVGLASSNQIQTSEGDSQKSIAAVKAVLAKSGKDVVINIDPNNSPDAVPLVKAAEDAGAWIVTHWNKPDDLRPKDYKHYVSYISADGVQAGYAVAKELFKAIDGKGSIVAVQGLLDNVPAKQRFQGLQNALKEFPDVKLLEDQNAEWDQTKALNTMQSWMTKYGGDIKAVWAANDSMALGCLEALRAKGLAGKVPVCGVDGTSQACKGVIAGEFAATMANNPFWQGGMGLSIGYHAWKGTFDPSTQPPDHREFYYKTTLVTKENAQQYLETVAVGNVTYNWEDIWGFVAGPVA